MKSNQFMFLFIFVTFVFSRGLYADPSNWNLRLSGGYGFSLNSEGVENSTGTFNNNTGNDTQMSSYSAIALSPGIPSGIELFYSVTPRLQVSLGIFPVVSNSNYSSTTTFTEIPASTNDYSFTQNRSENITYLPMLMSLYFNQPMGTRFNTFVGFGLGVVPSTSQTWTNTFTGTGNSIPTNNTEYNALNAGFALRGVIGMDYDFERPYGIFSNFRVGAEIQDLAFDQAILYGNTVSGSTTTPGQGWTGQTANFNQWAPMLFVEANLYDLRSSLNLFHERAYSLEKTEL